MLIFWVQLYLKGLDECIWWMKFQKKNMKLEHSYWLLTNPGLQESKNIGHRDTKSAKFPSQEKMYSILRGLAKACG